MTVYHQKLNQVVTLFVAAIPSVVFVLEPVNTAPGMWNAVIDPSNAFFSVLVYKKQILSTTRSNFSGGKASSIPLQFYLENVLTLQPCAMS